MSEHRKHNDAVLERALLDAYRAGDGMVAATAKIKRDALDALDRLDLRLPNLDELEATIEALREVPPADRPEHLAHLALVRAILAIAPAFDYMGLMGDLRWTWTRDTLAAITDAVWAGTGIARVSAQDVETEILRRARPLLERLLTSAREAQAHARRQSLAANALDLAHLTNGHKP